MADSTAKPKRIVTMHHPVTYPGAPGPDATEGWCIIGRRYGGVAGGPYKTRQLAEHLRDTFAGEMLVEHVLLRHEGVGS